MSDQAPKSKPTDMPGVVLRTHVYDGIEEYDQKLPNWWLFTLYIAIVFFVIYWFLYYQLGLFTDDQTKIEAQIAVVDQRRDQQLQEMLATLDNESLWKMSKEEAQIEDGKALFMGKCALCHAPDLSAVGPAGPLPGVALNDNEWVHGGQPMDVFNIITNGSPNLASGMIAWKTQMSPADIAKVAAFVMSHHAEGDEVKAVPSKFANPAGAAPAAPEPAANSQ